jgi:hypothetical protein
MASGNSTVVEYSTHNLKVKGLNPTPRTRGLHHKNFTVVIVAIYY